MVIDITILQVKTYVVTPLEPTVDMFLLFYMQKIKVLGLKFNNVVIDITILQVKTYIL